MREGPSDSGCRIRVQTTASCSDPTVGVVSVAEKAGITRQVRVGNPNQIARDVVLTRQARERNFIAQVLLRHLAFELNTLTAMTTGHTLVLLAR